VLKISNKAHKIHLQLLKLKNYLHQKNFLFCCEILLLLWLKWVTIVS